MGPLTPSRKQPPSVGEAVARLRLRYRHRTLRYLVAQGVLDWDRDEDVVRRGRNFETKWNEVRRWDTANRSRDPP